MSIRPLNAALAQSAARCHVVIEAIVVAESGELRPIKRPLLIG